MRSVSIDESTLAAFGCQGTQQALEGGEGLSVRVGKCVLKPIDNEVRYTWASKLLLQLDPKNYRIHRPLQTKTGGFVFNGWGASLYEAGEPIKGRWDKKLRVCRSFHAQLNQLQPSPMPPDRDPWSQAQEIAWQDERLPDSMDKRISEVIERLFDFYTILPRSNGIIHADMCGNILFDDKKPPCVIDFSPAYGSPQYAEAILITDAVAWEGAPLDLLQALDHTEDYLQLLLRAVNFRLIVAALFWHHNVDRFFEVYRGFEPIRNVLDSMIHPPE